jgi:protein-arginine kinase/protein-arginine kinase activator protein McsA
MKCEICHEHEAEQVLFRSLENGKREELYVCHKCAEHERVFGQERGIQVAAMDEPTAPLGGEGAEAGTMAFPPGMPKAVQRGFQEAFEQMAEKLQEMGITSEVLGSDEVCEQCKLPLNEIRLSGRVGCAHCVEQFRETVEALVEEAQGTRSFLGEEVILSPQARERRLLLAERQARIDAEDYAGAKACDVALSAFDAATPETFTPRPIVRPKRSKKPREKEEALKWVACRSQLSLVRNLAHELFPMQMKMRDAIRLGRELAHYFCEHEGGEDVTNDAFYSDIVSARYGLASKEDRTAAYRLVRLALDDEFVIWAEIMSANHLTFSVAREDANLEISAARLQAFVERLQGRFAFAMDAHLGVVAAQLSLMGAGMRVRTWMHLNGLVRYRLLEPLANAMEALGVYVEMEEGHVPDGHIYILFNRSSMEYPIVSAVHSFYKVLAKVAWHEMNTRRRFVYDHPHEVRDLLDGIRVQCETRKLFTEREAMHLLSDVMMALSVKILRAISLRRFFTTTFWFLGMQETLLPLFLPQYDLNNWMKRMPVYFRDMPEMMVAFSRGMWLRKHIKFDYDASFLEWCDLTMKLPKDEAEQRRRK